MREKGKGGKEGGGSHSEGGGRVTSAALARAGAGVEAACVYERPPYSCLVVFLFLWCVCVCVFVCVRVRVCVRVCGVLVVRGSTGFCSSSGWDLVV